MLEDPDNPGQMISAQEILDRIETLKKEIEYLLSEHPEGWLDQVNQKLEMMRKYLAILEQATHEAPSFLSYFKSSTLLKVIALASSLVLIGIILLPLKLKKKQNKSKETDILQVRNDK
ncbi:MAG: hypothetical protein Q4E22_04030 [Coriobacteriia bacterium]|nr:hypothetical protein [Coriobacteriia bacterium]